MAAPIDPNKLPFSPSRAYVTPTPQTRRLADCLKESHRKEIPSRLLEFSMRDPVAIARRELEQRKSSGSRQEFLAQKRALRLELAKNDKQKPERKKFERSRSAFSAKGTVPGPADLYTLAEALDYDVDLIFEWVYTNVDHVPAQGSNKGALGTLIDRVAGAIDQCSLLVSLLRISDYDCYFVLGSITLTAEEVEQWLGTDDSTDPTTTATLLISNAQIYCVPTYDGVTGELVSIEMDHAWVAVNLDGTLYQFDPSFKSYTYTTGIDLSSVISYNHTTLHSAAQSGATVDTDSIQNLNMANIASSFVTYGTDVLEEINTNYFDASMADIIGGRTIEPPATWPIRQTELPYQTEGSSPIIVSSIPDWLKTTYEVEFAGFYAGFYTEDLYGRRLTISFNESNEPELRANGFYLVSGDALDPDTHYPAEFTIIHWSFGSPFADQTWIQPVYSNGVYLLGNAFLAVSQSMVDYHRTLLQINMLYGASGEDEAALGESLAVNWFMHCAQLSASDALFNQLGSALIYRYHAAGISGFNSYQQGAFFDLPGNRSGIGMLNGDTAMQQKLYPAADLPGSGLEAGILQQNFPITNGVSAGQVLRYANTGSQKIFSGTSSNWSGSGGVRDQLTNWSGGTLAALDTLISNGATVVIHEDGDTAVSSWVGGGFHYINGLAFGDGISGHISGGAPSDPLTDNQVNKGAVDSPKATDSGNAGNSSAFTRSDPVSMYSGDYLYNNVDLTVGSGPYPYSLSFERNYSSGARFVLGPLGPAWTHNFASTATLGSNGLRALGEVSPKEAAAAIAWAYVMIQLDLLNGDLTDVLIGSTSTMWLMDRMTNNAVTVSEGIQNRTFIKLVDDSFNPAPAYADTLTDNLDGTYTVKNPQGVEWNFNTLGQLATQVFPFGVTVTCGYDGSDRLETVSNGMDRVLTLAYTDGYLSSVSDGNGREVSYVVDEYGIFQYTDAESNVSEIYYADPGQLAQIYLPEEVPDGDAWITNVYKYDSGAGKMYIQYPAGQYGTLFRFAGSRASTIAFDPNEAELRHVYYYNSMGSPIRDINELGQESKFGYDGLNRQVSTTYPEGNETLVEYDEKNNVTKVTSVAKPGSGLSDIVQNFTFDPVWNKVATAEDGEGNITISSYDATQGTLIQINRPSITTGSVTTITIGGAPTSGPFVETIRVAGQAATYLADTGDTNSDIASALSTAINALSLSGVSSTSSGADILLTAPVGTTLTATGLGGITMSNAIFVNIEITYNARGQVETRTDETGIVDKFEYSSTNETLETVTRDFGIGRLNLATSFGYTAWGDVNSITDPRSNETTFEFNLNRLMTKRIECAPFEFETNRIYNGNSWLTTLQRQTGEVDPEFQEWNWVYNTFGKTMTIIDPAGNELNFAYGTSSFGWLTSRTDAEGRQWQFQYDGTGRVVVTIDPRGNASETRTFTDNGMLATVTDARSNTTGMAYDGHDRLHTRTYPDSTFEQMTYNQNSQVLTMLTRAGDTIENTYDVLTRLETTTPGSLPTQTRGYDLASRLTSVSTPTVGGDPSSGEFAFGFDTAGRLISQTMPDSSVVAYQLDENGNRIRLTWPDSYYAAYEFDELNRLTDIKLNGDTDPAVRFDFDALSRRTSITYINGCSCAYEYAINNDMTSLEHTFNGSSVAFAMGYNKVHQVTSTEVDNEDFVFKPTVLRKTRYSTANNLNQYPAVNGAAVGYDNNGNLTSGVLDATFDPLNRITGATDGVVTNTYWTDPLNRQAQKEVDSTKTLFLHDEQQLIADFDDTPTMQNRYIPGVGLDEILIQIFGSDTTFLHKDRLGSVIAQTDDTGAVLNKYVYAPFGRTPDLTGTVFGFTGQRYDAELGLYNYKARYYAPGIGRFLQPDPIAYVAGDMNLYSYVNNDALNLVDPMGLFPYLAGPGLPQAMADYVISNNLMTWDASRIFAAAKNYLQDMPATDRISCVTCSSGLDIALKQYFSKENEPGFIGPKQLQHTWEFGTETMPAGVHSRSYATSSDPSEPDLTMDPWWPINDLLARPHGSVDNDPVWNKDPCP